jgi:hypothetical protein
MVPIGIETEPTGLINAGQSRNVPGSRGLAGCAGKKEKQRIYLDQRTTSQPMPCARMATETDHLPGGAAPAEGAYCLLNVLGGMTGVVARVPRGNPLPQAPRGFTWRLAQEANCPAP